MLNIYSVYTQANLRFCLFFLQLEFVFVTFLQTKTRSLDTVFESVTWCETSYYSGISGVEETSFRDSSGPGGLALPVALREAQITYCPVVMRLI